MGFAKSVKKIKSKAKLRGLGLRRKSKAKATAARTQSKATFHNQACVGETPNQKGCFPFELAHLFSCIRYDDESVDGEDSYPSDSKWHDAADVDRCEEGWNLLSMCWFPSYLTGKLDARKTMCCENSTDTGPTFQSSVSCDDDDNSGGSSNCMSCKVNQVLHLAPNNSFISDITSVPSVDDSCDSDSAGT